MRNCIETELEYLNCFSHCHADPPVLRFEDLLIEDMYSHNLSYITARHLGSSLQQVIAYELDLRRQQQKRYLNITCDEPVSSLITDEILDEANQVTVYDYYRSLTDHMVRMHSRADCSIRLLEPVLLPLALELDLACNAGELGEDFVRRRFERRSGVYLQPGLVSNYLLFHHDTAVGHADLFIHNGTAKIEDFDIIPEQRAQGFGTAMLRQLGTAAQSLKAEQVYLIADQADTVGQMYVKCGFQYVASKMELLFTNLSGTG